VRDVVLDADVVWLEFKLQLVGRFRFSGTLKRELQRNAAEFARKFRREIIRMQIGGDDLRFGLVKFFKIGNDAAEGGMGLLRFQIADVLADENLVADCQRHRVLQMRSYCQNDFRRAEFHDALILFWQILGLAELAPPMVIGSGA